MGLRLGGRGWDGSRSGRWEGGGGGDRDVSHRLGPRLGLSGGVTRGVGGGGTGSGLLGGE